VIEQVRDDFPSTRRLDIETLPPGWLGKPHALERGAEMASGDYLVFSDADVVLEPTTVSRAVAAMRVKKLDHLALVFRNSTSGGLLNAIVTELGAGLLWVIKPWRAHIPSSRFFVGVGAFNMVRADVYREIGCHGRVRMQVIDDLYLGKVIKNSGYAQDCLDGREFAAVPWYGSVNELITGLMKNVFAFFNYRFSLAALGVLALAVVVILPYWGSMFCSGATRALFFATLLLRVLAIGAGLVLSGVEKRALPWLLITPFTTIYIICRATALTLSAGGISWRDTFYPLDELKKQPWVLAGLFSFGASDKSD
jgi:glycosyltransferase involved in cell wall biosynthesis